MANDATLLLDLDGVSVARADQPADGRHRVHLVTADEPARACPACGVFATRVKGSAMTRPRDLPHGESGLAFRRRKRRWWCREAGCPRRSFTEQIPRIPEGAGLAARLRDTAGRRIRDAGSTVIQVARDLHLWCADSDSPEVRQFATAVDRWWPEIAAVIHTGHSNAKSEGINRVIKRIAACNAFGFRNPPTNAYTHAASPPAEPADTSAPLDFEDPARVLSVEVWGRS